jgi:hypothetical protein
MTPESGEPRFLGRQAIGRMFLNLPIEVIPDLFIQLSLDLVATEKRAYPQRQDIEPSFEAHVTVLLKLYHTRDGSGEPTAA